MKVSKRWFVIVDDARARLVERDQEGRFRTVSSFGGNEHAYAKP